MKPSALTPLPLALFAAAMLLSGAGCTPDTARWSPLEAPKESQVRFVALTHEVRFAPGSAMPAAGEDRRLADFLSRIRLGYGDEVTLDTGPRRGEREADGLAAKRTAAVAALLRRHQVKATAGQPPTVEGALAQDAVVVRVGRYVVTPPLCPDWRKPEADDYTNTPTSNYGCASAINLDAMVANPGDLVHGTPTAPADADFAARGIQRYRAGKISKSINPELSNTHGGLQ